jgi:peptidoglycan hydrolase-like protein with peptidoglycan-binding domain
MSYETLKEGSSGSAVVELQRRLLAAGYNPGPVDGIFGAQTKQAVMAFQRANGLVVDGIVGPLTWSRLLGTSATAESFVQRALSQAGDRYVYGAEVNLNDPNPTAFDCSELVEWAAHQVGVFMPDGTMNQIPYCQRNNTVISIDQAKRTRGALLFRPEHVAISLGNGMTIEARGSAYGVGSFSANREWTLGALVPGLRY